jgi:hypothetical protein
MKRTIFALLLITLAVPVLTAQRNSCRKFHLYSDCNVNPGPRFKFDGQSRSNIVGAGDQMIYNLVLYGNRQYKIYTCISDLFGPIHVVLINAANDEVIYDNANDEYLGTLTLNIEYTQRLKVSMEVLAEEMSEQDKLEYFGCIGMMIQYKENRD